MLCGVQAPDPPGTVLVADDESILRSLLLRILRRAGYAVREARDGGEVLRCVEEGEPLVAAVLDATIAPDGAAALFETLARLPGPPGLVVTSGESLPPPQRAELEARGGRFVAKPFAPAALLEAVEAVRPARG